MAKKFSGKTTLIESRNNARTLYAQYFFLYMQGEIQLWLNDFHQNEGARQGNGTFVEEKARA